MLREGVTVGEAKRKAAIGLCLCAYRMFEAWKYLKVCKTGLVVREKGK